MIVAVPAATPATTPDELTVANVGALEFHVTVLLVALAGTTVATKVVEAPTPRVAVAGLTLSPVTATMELLTLTTEVAVKPPSWVVAVITALPTDAPVTSPELLAVATDALPELHVTKALVALAGARVAFRVVVAPTFNEMVVGVTATPVTGTLVVLDVPPISKCE